MPALDGGEAAAAESETLGEVCLWASRAKMPEEAWVVESGAQLLGRTLVPLAWWAKTIEWLAPLAANKGEIRGAGT